MMFESKSKSERLLLVLAFVLLLPALVWADYPAEVPRTGQTTCYDTDGAVIDCAGTGQDGDRLAGAAWPDPRFVDNGDGTVTDGLTGLVWAKDANLMAARDPAFDEDNTAGDGAVSWGHALYYVAKLNSESYLGHDDWSLPNINELQSLISGEFYDPALPAGHPFTNVPDHAFYTYWSSTSRVYSPLAAWSVSLYHGGVQISGKSNDIYVLPVRAEPCGVVCLPKTGQTVCYSGGRETDCAGTGQDGELQHGVAWPDPRFIDHGDGRVTDGLTGLVWAKDANIMATRDPSFDVTGIPEDGQVYWQHAFYYVAKLNSENYLNHNDWRVPNMRELYSLVEHSQYDMYLPADHPFMNVSSYHGYWSSTSLAGSAEGAWGAFMFTHLSIFDAGPLGGSPKSCDDLVWPVRGGQVGNPLISSTTTSVAGGSTTTTSASSDITTTTITTGNTTTTTTPGGDEPCPATQVLGADNPQLDDLRDFRDGTLARSAVGRHIISLYYRNAPAINAALVRSPFLKAIARRVLKTFAQ